MTQEKAQNIFSKNLDTIVTLSETTREDLEKELAGMDEKGRNELEKSLESSEEGSEFDPERLRVFDDLDGKIDTVLRRRLVCSDKFKKAVMEIKDAVKSGAFIINIVAPEYGQYKALVDLVLSEAMVDESQVVKGENVPTEKIESDKESRYDKMLGHVISDIGVHDFISRNRNSPNLSKNAAEALETIIQGGSSFDPNDPVNACDAYVKDYEKDPNAAKPPAGSASATAVEGPRFLERRKRSNLYSLQDPIIQPDLKSKTFIPDSRSNMLYSDPMASPLVGTQSQAAPVPPIIFYDERASLPLRFDPDVESSYEYPDMSIEVQEREKDAAGKIRGMIENGMEAVPDIVKQKWILFIKMLSALEGTKQVSFFHLAGFDSNGEPRQYSPEPGGGRVDVSVPEIDPDDVERILVSFLDSIGVSDAEVKDQMKNAVVEELQGGSTPRDAGKVMMSPATKVKLTADQINARFENDADKYKYIAMTYIEEKRIQPGTRIASSEFRSWLEDKYPDFTSYFSTIYKVIFNALKQASSDVFLKTSVVDLEGKGENRVLGEMAYLASKELPVEKIKKAETLKSWISKRFGERYEDYWFKINKKLSVASKNFTEHQDGFIIEAAARNVTTTNLYNRLFEIIRNSTTFKAYEPIKSAMTVEYVIDLLIKFLHKKCFESTMISFESLKKKGTVPRTEFGGTQFLTFPFPQSEMIKYGIRSESDIQTVFSPGVSVLITSNDASETLQINQASFGKGNSARPGGPMLSLTFSSPPKNNYASGTYVLTIQESSLKLEGLVDDIYTQLYRQDATKVKEQHKANGVSLNLSIYPSWVPSPYDYRHDTASRDVGCGHPNNAYNIQLSLNKRIALRERYMRKNDYREDKRATVQRAVRRLEQEIAEMRYLLSHVSATVPTARLTEKQTYNSMVRNNSNPQEDPMFYKEVVYRCAKIGIDIGNYGQNINHTVIKGFLSPKDFDAFLAITKQVREEMQERRNVLILRHVDLGLSTAGGNGFLSLGTSEGGGSTARNIRTWNPGIQALVQDLHNNLSRTADPSSRKTHIVIISEAQIPSFFSQDEKTKKKDSMKVIYLATNTISTDEIESMFQYYQLAAQKNVEKELRSKLSSEISDVEKQEIERKLSIISPKGEDGQNMAPKITVPITVIRKAQSLLSNIGFQAVEEFIKKTCMSLVYEYSSGKKVGDILTSIEAQVKDDIERLREQDEVLSKIGIKAAQAKVTLNDYVTQEGTQWHNHVTGTLREKVNKIRSNTNKIDLFRRCLDLRMLFGNVSLGKSGPGDDALSFKVPFTPNDSVGKTFWFDCDPSDPDWSQNPIDKTAAQYARDANFDIQGEILDYVQNPGSEYSEYVQRDAAGNVEGIALAKDLQNINSCTSSVNSFIRQLEEAIKSEKSSYPTFLVLEGDPGTGKSIFAEVLANSLDCKLLSTTFDEVFYSASGEPKLRGGFEENVTRFFDILTSLTDTVLLVDEIDKFLVKKGLDSSKGDVDKVLATMQSRWETGASATSDVGKYERNNLHIVLTTNDWKSIQRDLSALASRLKPKYEVLLPAEVGTLKKFFSGSSIINNLMNSACQGDPTLAKLAKDLKNVYGNPDEKSGRLANDIIAKINAYDPSFFRRASLINPSVADRDLSSRRSIPFTGSIDAVSDFVNGWRMIENLIAGLQQPVTKEVDGQEQTFVPIDVICKKLSEILVYKSEKTGKTYARGNMRELMTIFRKMFSSHQAYLSGESAIPFNYKSLYTALSQTVFQFSVKDRTIEQEDVADIAKLSEEPASDGVDAISQFVPREGVDDPLLPSIEFLYTKENFMEMYEREREFSEKAGLEKNNDSGLDFLMQRLRENLLLATPDNPTRSDMNYKVLVQFADAMFSASGGGEKARSLKVFLGSYTASRNVIQEQYNKYVSSKDPKVHIQCFDVITEEILVMSTLYGNLRLLDIVEIFAAPQAQQFNASQVWSSFSERLDAINNSFNTAIKITLSKNQEGRENAWETITQANLEKVENAGEKIKYYASWLIDRPMTKEEWARWIKENPQPKILKEVDREAIREKRNALFGKSVPKKKTVEPQKGQKEKLKFQEPLTSANYDSQALTLGLHLQTFNTGDQIKVLNPRLKKSDEVFTVMNVFQDKTMERKENPKGFLITLNSGGGTLEPKDITKASGAGFMLAPENTLMLQQDETKNAPQNVPASPTNDLADVDLDASTTDYYFKTAMDIIKSRVLKKAQNDPIGQPVSKLFVKDEVLGIDIDSYTKAVRNREIMFSRISGTPFFKHTPTTSGSFIDDVHVMRIENPKTGPQNQGENVPT